MTFTARFRNQTVLLVGSSAFAAALVEHLARAGARVRWFSHDVGIAEELWLSGEPRQIEISFCEPRAIDFEEAAAVIATIGEPIVSRLSEQARAAGCDVAVVGRPELSTFNLDDGHEIDLQHSRRQRSHHDTSAHPATWLSVRVRRMRTFLSSLAYAF